MKKGLWQLLLGFIVFYYIVHVAYNLPDIVHGNSGPELFTRGINSFTLRFLDICGGFLFAVCPYLILYRFHLTGKIVYTSLLIPVALAIVFFLNYWLKKTAFQPERLRVFFTGNLFFFCVYILYGVVFYFIRYSYYKELQQKELLLQNRQSELSFLRSQLNPHFLFNSLNNIYALVYEGSDQSLPAIAGLSELLRYMLYDNLEKVPLEKELGYIRKYIALQKLRFDHEVKIDLQVRGGVEQTEIPPLLLIPFIENAFKHGDFSDGGEGLSVIVNCSSKKMTFHCFNTKGSGIKDAGGGIGLANIQRRLELLYPEKHVLDIEDGANCFTVNLVLQYE